MWSCCTVPTSTVYAQCISYANTVAIIYLIVSVYTVRRYYSLFRPRKRGASFFEVTNPDRAFPVDTLCKIRHLPLDCHRNSGVNRQF